MLVNEIVIGSVRREERKKYGGPSLAKVHLQVSMDPDLLAALKADAKEKGMTVSALVRAMARGYIGAVKLARYSHA